jgi:hypothetical protein
MIVPREEACPKRRCVSSTLQRSALAMANAYTENGEESASAMITPAPKPRAMFARQAMSNSPETDDASFCEPYTIKQGASTWEMHLTDPSPGVWTADMSCNWSGAMTAAALTCTAVLDGSYYQVSERTTSTYVISEDTVSSFGAMATVAVVDTSGKPLSSFPTAASSGASVSGSGAATHSPSTGIAPAGPLPTGAMALVGGAAGVFAAFAL